MKTDKIQCKAFVFSGFPPLRKLWGSQFPFYLGPGDFRFHFYFLKWILLSSRLKEKWQLYTLKEIWKTLLSYTKPTVPLTHSPCHLLSTCALLWPLRVVPPQDDKHSMLVHINRLDSLLSDFSTCLWYRLSALWLSISEASKWLSPRAFLQSVILCTVLTTLLPQY